MSVLMLKSEPRRPVVSWKEGAADTDARRFDDAASMFSVKYAAGPGTSLLWFSNMDPRSLRPCERLMLMEALTELRR